MSAKDHLTAQEIKEKFYSLTKISSMNPTENPQKWGLWKKKGEAPRLGERILGWTLVCSFEKMIETAKKILKEHNPDHVYLYYDYRESDNWVNWLLVDTKGNDAAVYRPVLKNTKASQPIKT